jgi:hypothetical protein
MTHGKSTQGSPAGGSMKSTGGALRDLLSSVAQQVESHLHPSSPTPPGSRHGGRGRRRPSRIRSWIGHDKDKEGDNSLHFTDSSDDEFHVADEHISGDGAGSHKKKDTRRHEDEDEDKGVALTPAQDDATMHMLPDEIREEETVDMLTGLMGDGFDREVARRILRRYDGNVDKAAGALLEGERGEELVGPAPAIQSAGGGASSWSAGPTQIQTSTSQTRLEAPSALAGRPNTPIDLTLDDDPDLQRAMQASMSTLHSESQSQMQVYAPSQGQGQTPDLTMQAQSQPDQPVFGPSERPPDPNWAIVPSHVRCFPFGVHHAVDVAWGR